MNDTQSQAGESGPIPERGTSTAASGPAGSEFEGQIAGFYLLAMLCGAPPRGLPGTTIQRVSVQQANMGRPLDDVVIHAISESGKPALLEIQVKRSISFTPTDPVFRKIVGQIAAAARRPEFWATRYELAIATSRGSRKIDGPYQDLLMMARQIGDSATFSAQLRLSGAANEAMRTFVSTFQSHLKDEGAAHDEESTWKLLRRLQILTFDFAAPGSASEDLARERALRTLRGDDAARADALWGNLIRLAITVASSGGDRTRATLLESLAPLGFQFAGDRQYARSRAALAENSRQALADIDNQVGNVVLTRHERVLAVHEALDTGRYVEIRGDAGVGKSGVLRQVAESLQAEGHCVVLSPGRCVPRGWTAMRTQLAFDGTLHDLLIELANDGGATIFIDNLDSFDEEERLTVTDFLRAAVHVPGVSVLATARTDFGVEEPSWLPDEATKLLGRAPSVGIDSLSEAEVEQLTSQNPALERLLSENHPARQVARNLFRLARIARRQTADPLPHTEAEMAKEWWFTADGFRDRGWRDRARVLNDLALQALGGPDILEVTTHPAEAVDALVHSGTLRNLAADRVSFRHDVLREWAMACALDADPSLIDALDVRRPAPATAARGIELAARMKVEGAAGSLAWHGLLNRLSGEGAHRSWRRAALLAPARSEAAKVALPRIQSILFNERASLLRELVRTVMAVEVVPASKAFAAAGVDPELIPAGMTIPKGPAWLALVVWLLTVGDGIPVEAIPEAVDLYTGFSAGTLGLTSVTPVTTRRLYRWLRSFEPRSDSLNPSYNWSKLDREQIGSLRRDLRMGFFMFARTTPDLAAEYLQAVSGSEHNEDLVRSILEMRGTLAQAAPAELAKLTEISLIERPNKRHRRSGDEGEEAFTYLDHQFLPSSPAQGPFFELLVNAPEVGLALIRRLVDHAIAHGSRGRSAGDDVIQLGEGETKRFFPWTRTYFWSRESNYYALTSALMALEGWAHRRVEAGEPFGTVLSDVLGLPGSCAAYLLVGVDLLISHWPKSAASAIEFLASPELLCLDRSRHVHDQLEAPDLFGLRALQTEPQGTVTTAELKRRVSRRVTLDELIGNFVLSATPEQLTKLQTLLRQAGNRLGPAGDQSDLSDPEFMVVHALNLADLSNWQEIEVPRHDGSLVKGMHYVSPPSEGAHLQALRNAVAERSSDSAMQTSITLAIDDPSRLSLDQLRAAVAWASRAPQDLAAAAGDKGDDTWPRMRREAVLGAAMMTMRAGDASLLGSHAEWARAQLEEALNSDEKDPVHHVRAGLRFNPVAIAFAGLAYSLAHRSTRHDIRTLLEATAAGRHAAAHGFGAALATLVAVDDRLPRALLRCAFNACIVPVRDWQISDDEKVARAEQLRTGATSAVDAELAWLDGAYPEPQWPRFPEKEVRARRGLRIPARHPHVETPPPQELPAPEVVVHHQTASLWLAQLEALGSAAKTPWLRDLVTAYMTWTIKANGAELADGEEADGAPSSWNDAFFALTARCAVGLTPLQMEELVTAPISALPDQNFYDVLSDFLRSFDSLYFNGSDVDAVLAASVRSALADRMIASTGWMRLVGTRESSIEMHIAPAIATLFFNDHHFGGRTKTYLLGNGAARLGPFLPVLDKLVQSGPSPFVALVLLNLLEIAPRAEHLELLIRAGKTWLSSYPDFRSFWIDHGFGKRWCEILEKIHASRSDRLDPRARADALAVLADLVGLGVPEGVRVEDLLSPGHPPSLS